MGERYTITMQSLVTVAVGGVGWIEEDYGLTKLIPVKYRGRKFKLYSSFKTGNTGGVATVGDPDYNVASGLEISLTTIPQSYNVRTSYEDAGGNTVFREGVVIGMANPTLVWTGVESTYTYSYSENECAPVMIDYPEGHQIRCIVYPVDRAALDETLMTLRLCFELMQ